MTKSLFLHRLRYHCCCSKPISYLLYLSPNLLSSFSIFNKYDESLHSRNPVSLSANLGNVYFVFLPHFDRFWSRGTSVEAPTCTAATIASSVFSFFSGFSSSWRAIILMSWVCSYMMPVIRTSDGIFTNRTVWITAFMVSYEMWMNGQVTLVAFTTIGTQICLNTSWY